MSSSDRYGRYETLRGGFRWLGLGIAGWLSLLGAGVAAEAGSSRETVQETPLAGVQAAVEHQGIVVEMSMEPVAEDVKGLREGDDVRVRFHIRDTATRTPLARVYPAAWMDRLPEGKPSTPDQCQQKVQAFIGGSLLAPPEVDLNVYHVLALNEDPSITVVDPLFGFGTTKLLALVELRSPGEDWALTPDQERLFVSLPDSDQVAVVNTATWKVETYLNVGPRPTRLALQSDGKLLWVAIGRLQGGGVTGVAVVDAELLSRVATLATGPAPHDFAVSDDDRFVFITNGDGTLSVVDGRTLKVIRTVPVGADPTSLAYSTAAKAVYVASQDGAIVAVEGEEGRVRARIEAEPGLGQIRFAPGGRLGFALNPRRNLVHILDAATNQIVQTGDLEEGPDQVAFTDELAYVRHRESEIVLMIPLNVVGQPGAPVPVVDFPGGQHPPGRMGRPTPADGMVQAPGASAILVANPQDRAIYYYKEGMAAPMGHFRNYGRKPRAVMVVDRSLQERAPGRYETTVKLRRPGTYELAFFLDSPRMVHCFSFEIGENPDLPVRRKGPPVVVSFLMEEPRIPVGEEVSLRFRLSDPTSGALRAGIADVQVLTFLAPGIWQKRQRAQEVGEGIYEIRFTPPKAGVYYVFLASGSLGLRWNRSPYIVLDARETAAASLPPAPKGPDR